MSIVKTIEAKLRQAFTPEVLQVTDDSAKHAGHESLPPGMSESHVSIVIVSDKFAGLSRVARSRAVYGTIDEEVRKIHAITQMKTLTPEEYHGT